MGKVKLQKGRPPEGGAGEIKRGIRTGKWIQTEDYSRYKWTGRELVLESIKCAGITVLFAWFFYRSVWAVLPMSLVGAALWRKDRRKKKEEDRRKELLQFCDCICSADTSIRAGYSVENAFVASIQDMRHMYGEDSLVSRDLERIRKGLVINIAIEELFMDWGNRSGLSVIREFAEVLAIAKRSGGSVPDMIRTSAEVVQKRMEAEEEIYTQTTSRRMEQRIMNMMPFGIAIYLESGNPGYFDVLFHNFQGICIMSACLFTYLAAYYFSERVIGRAVGSWE